MPKNRLKTSNIMFETILLRRSIRRFQQQHIPLTILHNCINAARLAPSAANLQQLEYVLVTDKSIGEHLFQSLGWAAYLQPKWTPSPKERPTAYIVVLVTDVTNKYYQRDVGLATENIVLTAESYGLGSCILCNIDRNAIRNLLHVPSSIEVDSVIALGYKQEEPIVEDIKDSVKYWRDQQGILHVPKRKIEDIIHINTF